MFNQSLKFYKINVTARLQCAVNLYIDATHNKNIPISVCSRAIISSRSVGKKNIKGLIHKNITNYYFNTKNKNVFVGWQIGDYAFALINIGWPLRVLTA